MPRGRLRGIPRVVEAGPSGTVRWNSGASAGASHTRCRRPIRTDSRSGAWKRGRLLAALALLLGLFLMLHARIPNRIGNLGSLVETFLPWFGLVIPVLLVAALLRRSAFAVTALLLPVTVWLSLFGGLLVDKSQPGSDLTVASHNVGADNPDPAAAARDLAASGADVIALEELTPEATSACTRALAKTYRYHAVRGTVGVWSKLPLSGTQSVAFGMDSTRALRTTVTTAHGPLAVYVAHLGSVRVLPRNGFWTADRDAGARALGKAIAAESIKRVVLLGDLNGTLDDRAFADISPQLRSAQDAAGDGFGFSWPAQSPVVRIDQILVRGVEPKKSWVLPATGSDHRPVAAGISW